MAITNPLAYYKLDEISGNATDSVGSLTATNTNVTYSTGKINNGANFNGTSSKLNISNTGISPTTAMSFSCWINCSSYTSRQSIFVKSDGATNSGSSFVYEVGNTSGKTTATLFIGATNITLTSTATLTSGVWTHLAFTYDNSNLKIYINGTLDSTVSGSGTINNTTNDTTFGAYSSLGSLWLNGSLDEIGIWNTSLTALEINKIYNAGRGNSYPFIDNKKTSLISYYKLDGNSTDSVSSANGTDTSITYSAGNGKIVQGAGFNGTSSNILLPNNDWSATTGYSMQAWLKTTSILESAIIDRDNAVGAGRIFQFRMEATTGKIGFIRFDSSTSVVTNIQSSGAINDGNWHHIVVTFDNTIGSKIYVDGTSVASDSVTTNNRGGTGSAPYIGIFNGATTPWNGALDEIAIWNRGITSSEVTELYNGGMGIQYPFNNSSFLILM